MGVGGVTALGCTIGQGMSGVSTLALGSFIALAAIIGGAVPALRYQAWRVERMAMTRRCRSTAAPTSSAASAACAACTATPATRASARARVAVVGLGGVGSWAAEALARSGVAALTLIDLDHVAESNINRQVQALGADDRAGQGAGAARAHRARSIPAARCTCVEEFADEDNWPALLPAPVDAVIDACDQVPRQGRDGRVGAAHATRRSSRVGAAGGKQLAQAVEVDDLAAVTHDPLLASLRQRLRKQHGAPRSGPIGVRCVFSRESVALPPQACALTTIDGNLNCHGYGSSVAVTATFGMVAAAGDRVLRRLRGPAGDCKAAAIMRGSAGLLAQSVEQRTFNPLVAGSNPAQPTIRSLQTDCDGTSRALSSVGRAADS